MLDFDNISRVAKAAHDTLADETLVHVARLLGVEQLWNVEHCQTCGGYIGDYGPRYARHHDACECRTCTLCNTPIYGKIGFAFDDDGNWYHIDCADKVRDKMETDNDDPEVFSYA